MAITAKDVLQDAINTLQDDGNVHWPLPELAKALNSGLLAMATLQPRATSITRDLPLEEGTQQSLPAGVTLLMRVFRNTSGPSVTQINRDTLDQLIPDWHDPEIVPQSHIVQHVVYDESDPETFHVFPGNTGAGSIVAQVSKTPTLIAATSTSINDYNVALDVADTYFNALVHYVLYKAFAKDIQMSGNAARAQGYMQMFREDLGLRRTVEVADDVKAERMA